MQFLLPAAGAIITLIVAVALWARDADDHRGHRRWWMALALGAVAVLVAWGAIIVLIYSQASSA